MQSRTGLEPSGFPSFVRRAFSRLRDGRTTVALTDQALVSGANFITNVLLARNLGIRDYGVFTLAWLAVLFANSLQYALIVTPMMSIGPKQDNEERPAYFGSVLLQEIAFALFAALAIFVSVLLSTKYFPQWNVGDIALPLSAATLAHLLQDYLRRYFFCIGKRSLALASDIASYGLQVPIIFWLCRRHVATISSALWVIAATSFLGFLLLFSRYLPVRFDALSGREVWKRHWKMSRWLVSSAFMQWGAGNLFLLAAPVYYGAAASAILRASVNIVAVANVWFLGLDNIVPAEAARRMRHNGVDAMLRYLKRIFLQWGGVTLAFMAVIGLFPTFWLRLAYGSKYASDGYVLRLYALLYLITFMSGPLRTGLLALEYTSPLFWAYPVMITFSVALAGPFAKLLGLQGVLLGMCSTQLILQAVIGISLFLKVRRVRGEVPERVGVD